MERIAQLVVVPVLVQRESERTSWLKPLRSKVAALALSPSETTAAVDRPLFAPILITLSLR